MPRTRAVAVLVLSGLLSGAGGGAGAVRALIRPEQLSVTAGGRGSPARVESVRSHGSHIEIDLVVAEEPDSIVLTLRLPRYRSPEFSPGGTMRVCVCGSVVLYDA
jgi:hypothetical protein